MLLDVQKISITFPEKTVLTDVSFHVQEKEKVAVVGVNGAGKTTLIKVIAGELAPDAGQVVIGSGVRIACLSQHPEFPSGSTIYKTVFETDRELLEMEENLRRMEQSFSGLDGAELNEAMRAYARLQEEFERRDGYAYRSEVLGVLAGLGFEKGQFDEDPAHLSGGQKTRLLLAKLLLEKPDLLLLDEPTNHLDIRSIEWLESYLNSYDGAVLLVSHDRYFLNRIVSRVIEIEHAQAFSYDGNYDAFTQKKAEKLKAEQNAYLADQRRIKHEEEVIATLRRFNREKSIKRAQSREKKLERMDVREAPKEVKAGLHLTLSAEKESGQDVLAIDGLAKSFDGLTLFSDFSCLIRKGDRLVLIGENGTGKSTLLKILTGNVAPDHGGFRFGANVEVGYYDQENQQLHPENTIFEEISDAYPDLNNTAIRTTLARFLFFNEDVFKQVGDLSGGERARVSLAKLMLSKANLLILDEPTNHLDIHAKTALEEAIRAFSGTVLCVTHDRYFANRIATRMLELSGKSFRSYLGNYDDYLQEKARRTDVASEEQEGKEAAEQKTATKISWEEQKKTEAAKRKRENDRKRTEERIEEIETRIREIEEAYLDPAVATDVEAMTVLSAEQAGLSEELEDLYLRWEDLC